jgi:enoyl-CoA hydratase/carnithine racemase
MTDPTPTNAGTITTEVRGHVLLIGLNRPQKLNAFNEEMLRALSDAYTRFESDDALRCAVLFGAGKDFTAGLDLASVMPGIQAGGPLWPLGGVDPVEISGPGRTKPLVIAMQGRVFTIGIELALASDIRLCSDDANFAQLEIARGIFPFGGATFRAPAQLGWGNAMRFLLTAEPFNAAEALRIGLVQEVLPRDKLFDRAVALAEKIASQAPLGVRATLASARLGLAQGEAAAAKALPAQLTPVLKSDDAREGVQSFIERRAGRYTGK